MATIVLTAHACTFENTATARCMSYKPFDKPLHRETIEASNCAQIDAASRAIIEQLKDSHTGSFMISARLQAGRAPSGFRQRRPIEVDRDTDDGAHKAAA